MGIIFPNNLNEKNILQEIKIFKLLMSTGFDHKFSHYIISETPKEIINLTNTNSTLLNFRKIIENHIQNQINNLGYGVIIINTSNIINFNFKNIGKIMKLLN